MNLRILGFVLLMSMFFLGLTRDFLEVDIPRWLSILVGASGIIVMGVHYYKIRELRKYALILGVYFVLMMALIFTQFLAY